MKRIAILAFSEQGYELAEQLGEALSAGTCEEPGAAEAGSEQARDVQCEAFRSGQPDGVMEWTAKHFLEEDALIYVGACGIAVRAIAPHVKDKTKDPAVCVMDERGMHVISVLSGHLGGANDLTRRIAKLTGADPVITTATDVNAVFAVDEWSKRQNCALIEKERIVRISGALLAGKEICVKSDWEIAGGIPQGIRLAPPGDSAAAASEDRAATDVDSDAAEEVILLTLRDRGEDALHLIPRICVLGIGCRRGTSAEVLEERLQAFLKETGIREEAIRSAATIDLKKDEAGLLEFVEKHGWSLQVYTAEELAGVEGDFTPSEFVSQVTGVDNVCERSAVCAAGGVRSGECAESEKRSAASGTLIERKFAGGGVTFALAAEEYEPDWEWKE